MFARRLEFVCRKINSVTPPLLIATLPTYSVSAS